MTRVIEMKRISLLFLLVVLICSSVWAKSNQTSYYVDAVAGSDTNNGTSEAIAWQSLSKVNRSSFSPRDQILSKSEQVFFGTLKPRSSGNSTASIVVGKYGGDSKPIINGENKKASIHLVNLQGWEFQPRRL